MIVQKIETVAKETLAVHTHIQVSDTEGDAVSGGEAEATKPARRARKERKGEEGRNLQLRPGYMYREGNWETGRAAERAKVKIKEFKPRDRWTAWRKATAR